MPYALFYQKDAKAEQDEAEDTYPGFRKKMRKWLAKLAEEAERRQYTFSVDLLELIEEALASKPSSWQLSWRRWLSASLIDKMRALVVVAKKRCPPWELRVAARQFMVVNTFDCEAIAYFEVDHVAKRIVFRKFEGLPGQG